MIKLKNWLFSKNNNKKYKKQQLLKALKNSYYTRKKKLRSKKIFNVKKTINLTNNIGIKTLSVVSSYQTLNLIGY